MAKEKTLKLSAPVEPTKKDKAKPGEKFAFIQIRTSKEGFRMRVTNSVDDGWDKFQTIPYDTVVLKPNWDISEEDMNKLIPWMNLNRGTK